MWVLPQKRTQAPQKALAAKRHLRNVPKNSSTRPQGDEVDCEGGESMDRDRVISLVSLLVMMIFLAWFLGVMRGESQEHRRNELQGVKARLFKMEQAQNAKKEGE